VIISFGLPQVFRPSTDTAENADSLAALLEALIAQNRVFRKYHSAPLLYESGVVYGRTTEWENIAAVRIRGYADCKSLSAWLISDYRDIKKEPAKAVFRWLPRQDGSGAKDFHILVLTRNGYECPSKRLGMNAFNASVF